MIHVVDCDSSHLQGRLRGTRTPGEETNLGTQPQHFASRQISFPPMIKGKEKDKEGALGVD